MPALDADTRRAVRRVRRTLDDAGVVLTGRRVLALCSGGIDSCVLVELLARLPRGAAPASVDVLWLDHGARPGAQVEVDRASARAVAEWRGFTVHERSRGAGAGDPAPGGGDGFQADARAWRYAIAADVARELGCDVVATGHTADDQLECALLGLVGVTAAARPVAMSVARPLAPGAGAGRVRATSLVRPLLGVTRAAIERVAAEAGIEHAEDPTNADPDAYVRNGVRHRVVPELLDIAPGAGAALARAAERERERADSLVSLADALLAEWGTDPAAGDALDVRRVARLDPPARRALLERWLRRTTATAHPDVPQRELDARTTRAVDSLVVLPGRAACARVDLAGGACVRRAGYDLLISPQPAPPGGSPS